MAAFIALQCISPTGGLATITRRRAARRRSISAADELWVDFPGAYGAGINGRLECSARVSREPERGPVERVRLLGEARALRPAQCLRRPVRGERVVEPAHQDEGGAIVHLPERRDDGGSACVEERALQPDQLVATRELAQARLARREHDPRWRSGRAPTPRARWPARARRRARRATPPPPPAPHARRSAARAPGCRAPPPARARPCPCWAGTSVRWRSARWTGASPPRASGPPGCAARRTADSAARHEERSPRVRRARARAAARRGAGAVPSRGARPPPPGPGRRSRGGSRAPRSRARRGAPARARPRRACGPPPTPRPRLA